MTPAEYVQLKAFARIDGALLALLWVASFACYIVGLTNSVLGFVSVGMVCFTPFFVAKRLRSFRDYAREGVLSFLRGWAYGALMFFYAGLLFAIVQYAYFSYLDHGYVLNAVEKMAEMPEFVQMLSQYEMEQTFQQMLQEIRQVRPIDLALNMLSTNLMAGVLLGLPIAAFVRSASKPAGKQH